MEKIKIEKLKKENVESVFQIEKTFFDVQNSDSIEASLNSETLQYFLLYVDENLVGFLECSIVLDEAELFEIAIDVKFQGKGYSKILMKYFLDFCEKRKVRTIFLEVNKINSKAISLYKKFGFISYGERKKYYGDNDAILMRLERNWLCLKYVLFKIW